MGTTSTLSLTVQVSRGRSSSLHGVPWQQQRSMGCAHAEAHCFTKQPGQPGHVPTARVSCGFGEELGACQAVRHPSQTRGRGVNPLSLPHPPPNRTPSKPWGALPARIICRSGAATVQTAGQARTPSWRVAAAATEEAAAAKAAAAAATKRATGAAATGTKGAAAAAAAATKRATAAATDI